MSGSLSDPGVSSTPVDQGFIAGLSPSVAAWLGPAAQDESGGNPGATNPTSTAAGLYQFTQPTWDGLVQQYGKQYGLTPNGRTDAQQARIGAQLIAQNQYLPALRDVGITNPSPDDIQQVHFWGAPTFKKLFGANSPNTPLRQVLGQDFNEIYNANAGLFGNNPNITVGQAGAAVDRHMPAGYGSTSMLPTQLGGGYAGTGQPMSGSVPAAGGILSASNIQSPQTPPQPLAFATPSQNPTDTLHMSPKALEFMRWAAGAAGGGSTLLGGLGGGLRGILNGQQQDQQQALRQQQLAQLAQYRQESAAQAAQITGYTPQGQQSPAGPPQSQALPMSPALAQATMKASAGQQQQGQPQTPPTFDPNGVSPSVPAYSYNMPEAQPLGIQKPVGDGSYVAPGGQMFTETMNGQGVPSFRDLSTGRTYGMLPPGTYPVNSPQVAAQIKADTTALQTDRNAAVSAEQQMAQGQQLLSLLPQLTPGSSLQDEFSRWYTTKFGGDGQAAQQQANMLFSQMNTNRMHMISGYGRVDLPMVKAVLGAGASWQDNPAAIRGIIAFTDAQAQYAAGAANTWNNLSPAQQSSFGGYSAFKQRWLQANPETNYITNYLKNAQNSPEFSGGSQAQPQAAPTVPTLPGKPPLSSFWTN